jgi:predicted transposase YdaD
MKTDAAFYELFKFDPSSIFKLSGIKMESEYVYESITVKTTERRLDGFLRSTDDKSPLMFVEIQGYENEEIYWNGLRKISTYYEQEKDKRGAAAVFLFLDKKYDPGMPKFLTGMRKTNLKRVYLIEALKKVKDNIGALTILKPLILKTKSQLEGTVKECVEDIKKLELTEAKEQKLLELLNYIILERFSNIPLKEVQKMLGLTPLEKTVAGQELIQIGRQEGIERGKLIGEIQLMQRLLKMSVTSEEELIQKSIESLKALLQQLERSLFKS